jgi:hypothetical protein
MVRDRLGRDLRRSRPDDPGLAVEDVEAILSKPYTDAELAHALWMACARHAERERRVPTI